MPALIHYGEKPEVKVFEVIPVVRVKVISHKELLNITRLSKAARRHNASTIDKVIYNLTWRCIKRNQPALAQLLTDPFLQELQTVFDAEICIEI